MLRRNFQIFLMSFFFLCDYMSLTLFSSPNIISSLIGLKMAVSFSTSITNSKILYGKFKEWTTKTIFESKTKSKIAFTIFLIFTICLFFWAVTRSSSLTNPHKGPNHLLHERQISVKT